MNISSIMGSVSNSVLSRIMPEPKSNYSFSNILTNIKDSILGTGSSVVGIDSQYADLISKQMEMQEQMMLVSMVSNIEKTTHETKMAAVRNIRTS